jgi:glycosyltransferase domain-containing protein
MAPRLTIVLPLKGRHLFTLRFLWHANKARLPYRFLIADGQVHPELAGRLEDSRKTFPALDIEYIRYPDDVDLNRFFSKMSDALQRVRTPYAMLADNDDFLGFDGIEQALDFLDASADYVCARGRMVAFSVYSGLGNPGGGVRGRLNRLYLQNDSADFSAPSAAERVRRGGIDPAIYNAVYRAGALATIFREAAEIDFSDLMLHESFHALRALTLGKVRTNRTAVSYFRQLGTSLTYQPSRDWVHHLLRSRFTSDAHAMVERISTAGAEADSADKATIAEDVRTVIEDYFRWFLSTNYGLVTQIKRIIRRKSPRVVSYLQNRPRFFVARERSALIRRLARAGASRKNLAQHRAQLAEIERALSREAFASFAGPFLPTARADGKRDRLYAAVEGR